ncbi:MAG: hypothetical protein ACTSPI_17405 [Candidatus Heimdallarchaeaceae archaeon]
MKKTSAPVYTDLTFNEKSFLTNYIATWGNATESARLAFKITDTEKARAKGAMQLKKLEQPLSVILDDLGLTDTQLALSFVNGLGATKVYPYAGKIYKVPDWQARLAYLRILLRIKGLLPTKMRALGDKVGNSRDFDILKNLDIKVTSV